MEGSILMRVAFLPVLMLAFSLYGFDESDCPAWVNACEVVSSESAAERLLVELSECGFDHAGYLWIPDWQSLSSYEGWVVYTGPYGSSDDAVISACNLLWKYPDIYSILVSHDPGRTTTQPSPGDPGDLLGLMPPTEDFTHQSIVPESWESEWTIHGQGEEWEHATQITSYPPGWFIDEWEDIYAGTIEMRGVTEPEDITAEYERVSAFLRTHAEALNMQVMESAGVYILLHRLPDPADRRGDVDFWVAIDGNTLEYGFRVRSFYGEMPPSWSNIPQEARQSSIPDAVRSYSEALDFLIEELLEDGVLDSETLGDISFSLEYLDRSRESEWRDYYDITLREVHRPGGEGDPNTAPVLHRFRVYARAGEILWWNPVYGVFMPYTELFTFETGN
jgi:hypothetical protein